MPHVAGNKIKCRGVIKSNATQLYTPLSLASQALVQFSDLKSSVLGFKSALIVLTSAISGHLKLKIELICQNYQSSWAAAPEWLMTKDST